MDSGLGKMVEINAEVAKEFDDKGVNYFRVGEIIEIKGSRFKITKITPKKLILRILPK